MDDEKKKPTDITISEGDITAALDRAGAKVECPSCGNNRWLVGGSEGKNVSRILGLSVGESFDPSAIRSIPCAAFVCTKCGYIRLHSLHILKQLVDNGGSDV